MNGCLEKKRVEEETREVRNYYVGIEVPDSHAEIMRNWLMIVIVLNTPSMIFNLIMYYESFNEQKYGFLESIHQCFFSQKITYGLDHWISIDEYSRLGLILFFIVVNIIYGVCGKKDKEGNMLTCCGIFLLVFSMYHFGWIVFGFV